MKRLFISHVLLFLTFTLSNFPAQADYWTQKANFPGLNRDLCFSFSIETSGYVGCGRDSNLQKVNTFGNTIN